MAFWDCDANTAALLDAGLPDPRTATATESSQLQIIARMWGREEHSSANAMGAMTPYQIQVCLHQLRQGATAAQIGRATDVPINPPGS